MTLLSGVGSGGGEDLGIYFQICMVYKRINGLAQLRSREGNPSVHLKCY